MVSVIARYFSDQEIEKAEDIVQDTILKAIQHWRRVGVPNNPRAWMYQTARNLSLNTLKREKKFHEILSTEDANNASFVNLDFSEDSILDEQLHMMFACCDQSLPEQTQIALMLKILCGFSIAEIATAFFTKTDTINKRLVRGRERMRDSGFKIKAATEYLDQQETVLKAIYLLFNEGYHPGIVEQVLRPELCHEAIRLVRIMIEHPLIVEKGSCHALLAMMYLNSARFNARINEVQAIIPMENQDRKKWDSQMINLGIHHLSAAVEYDTISQYLVMACISAEHCTAPSFETTNWQAILDLYDQLLFIDDSPVHRMNRAVVLAMTGDPSEAIEELTTLNEISPLSESHILHATLAYIYERVDDFYLAKQHYESAYKICRSEIDKSFILKKMKKIVPDT